jgi:hypothetical protein
MADDEAKKLEHDFTELHVRPFLAIHPCSQRAHCGVRWAHPRPARV